MFLIATKKVFVFKYVSRKVLHKDYFFFINYITLQTFSRTLINRDNSLLNSLILFSILFYLFRKISTVDSLFVYKSQATLKKNGTSTNPESLTDEVTQLNVVTVIPKLSIVFQRLDKVLKCYQIFFQLSLLSLKQVIISLKTSQICQS